MKRVIILFAIVLIWFSLVNAQKKPTSQTNYSLNFETFLSGVKYADIHLTKEQFQIWEAGVKYLEKVAEVNKEMEYYIIMDMNRSFIKAALKKSALIENEPKKASHANLFTAFCEDINKMGFDDVVAVFNYSAITSKMFSLCDIVKVYVNYDYSHINKLFSNISITFESCNNDRFVFKSYKQISVKNFSGELSAFREVFHELYPYKKPFYSYHNRLKLKRNPTSWTEYKLKEHWKNSGIDEIEGIYENSVALSTTPKYKVGTVKTSEGYNLIYLSGATFTDDWDIGEIKAELLTTATPGFFKVNWIMADKSLNEDWYISFEQGIMNVIQSDSKDTYIKLYPTERDNIKPKGIKTQGTGFAISSDGLIVTNNHIVQSASEIKVKGINDNFSKSYNASVILSDEKNDLAIIKIDDKDFATIGTLPFTIKSTTSDVGTDVFVLGYPLTATMGDEIKLTNGIISSKSGFKGDITSYQMTAPIQPGNSGAPLFDKNGYLIGIVNAKHWGTENVGYAIKSSYLNNLIESLTPKPKLTTQNLLIGKSLTGQVKLIKKFIYIIDVN